MFKLFTYKGKKINLLGISKGMIISTVIVSIVVSIALFFKIDQEQIWKLLLEAQKHLKINFGEELNKDIINNPELLDYKVKSEVDKAIVDYERLTGDGVTVKLPSPRYSEKSIDNSVCYTPECRSLGGEMRLCSPWMPDCPDTFKSVTEQLTQDYKDGILKEWLREDHTDP